MEALLRLRRMEEDRALEQLSRVMLRVNEQQAIRDAAAKLLREEMNYFEQKHRDDFTIDFFKMYDLYIERLEREDRLAAEKLDGMRPDLDAARGVVIEASKKRRIVEQLRERHKERYQEEVRKAERKELDEYRMLRGASKLTQAFHEAEPHQSRSTTTMEPADEPELVEPEQHEHEDDLIAQYYKQLGIPDPRQ